MRGRRPLLLALVAVGACSHGPDPDRLASSVTARDLARITRAISSDEFRGRGPDSPGEQLTLDYLRGEFDRLGLEPMGDLQDGARSWLQSVPVARITTDPMAARLAIAGGDARRDLPLRWGEDFVAWTRRFEPTVEVEAPLVFAGYGVVAPEENWNDYSRDLAGAIVLLLVNDPPGGQRFDGAAMTYYGRWTYKFEEAARQGAAGVLLIHQEEAAGYGWSVVRSSWTGPQFHLPPSSAAPTPVGFESWISEESAARIFAATGSDLEEAIAAASRPGFEPVDLGLTARLELVNQLDEIVSHNVAAGLRGRASPAAGEWLLWTAHWDHLGTDPALPGDTVYNGALDNATGIAALLEIAEALATSASRTRRSHLFLATTLEERGLLGSSWYAANPLVAPARTVAAINIDGLNVWGATRDLTVVGLGKSELDEMLAAELAAHGRVIAPDPEPEKGYYYRSDHFPLARAGIPALYVDAGMEFLEQEAGYGERVRQRYVEHHYHRPSDEFDPAWDFAGAEADVRALLRVGVRLADGDRWPAWAADAEFRAARERTLRSPDAD